MSEILCQRASQCNDKLLKTFANVHEAEMRLDKIEAGFSLLFK